MEDKTPKEEERLKPSSPTAPVKPEVDEKKAKDNSKAKAKTKEEEKLKPSKEVEVTEVEEDYLRKFQYRKEAEPGSKGSDPQVGSKAEKMKAHLLSQKRVSTMIPAAEGEDLTVKHTVTLNGYRLDIPKNVYVELPLQVHEVILESLNQTNAAIMRGQIGLSKAKEEALI